MLVQAGISIMGISELREKRQEILRLVAKHGARNIRVFGLVVRDEAGDESDIDFLVEIGTRTQPA